MFEDEAITGSRQCTASVTATAHAYGTLFSMLNGNVFAVSGEILGPRAQRHKNKCKVHT